MKGLFFILSAFCLMPKGYAQHPWPKLGLLETTAAELDSLPQRVSVNVPPDAKLDPAKDLSALMPPAGNQKKQGACAAFSTAYAYLSYLENLHSPAPYQNGNGLDKSKVFSPAFIFNTLALAQIPKRIECQDGILFIFR